MQAREGNMERRDVLYIGPDNGGPEMVEIALISPA